MKQLHDSQLVHFDLKLRNVLLCDDDDIMLCDLDAASDLGSLRDPRMKSPSSAYSAPEVTRFYTEVATMEQAIEDDKPSRKPVLECAKTIDIWSFGVILFELCAGRVLFPQDVADDELAAAGDEFRKCVWNCISDDVLESIFSRMDENDLSRWELRKRDSAKDLIRWCLRGDPSDRPQSMSEVLCHAFFADDEEEVSEQKNAESNHRQRRDGGSGGADHKENDPTNVDDGSGEHGQEEASPFRRFSDKKFSVRSLDLPESLRDEGGGLSGRLGTSFRPKETMRYHLFISHMQKEASGDVGTLYHLLDSMGISAWRDMSQDDLTENGMQRGVRDSDIFVLFLTNATLSRPWCLKEIGWALEMGKKIIILAEGDNRFWPFDVERWRRDECVRGKDGAWTKGWLASTYADCPEKIKDLVETVSFAVI